MKITSCYPLYAATDFSKVIDYLINQQSYKVLHKNSFGIHKLYTLESDKGYRLDVAYLPDVIEGVHATRINVDNFADGCNFFTSMGYVMEDTTYENIEMRLVFLAKEGTGRICLVQHIRDEVTDGYEL